MYICTYEKRNETPDGKLAKTKILRVSIPALADNYIRGIRSVRTGAFTTDAWMRYTMKKDVTLQNGLERAVIIAVSEANNERHINTAEHNM